MQYLIANWKANKNSIKNEISKQIPRDSKLDCLTLFDTITKFQKEAKNLFS